MRFFAYIVAMLMLHVTLGAVEQEIPSEDAQAVQEQQNNAQYVQVKDIPEIAVKTLQSLKNMAETLTPSADDTQMYTSIPSTIQTIDTLLQDPFYENVQEQSIRDIEKHQQEWRIYKVQLQEWEERLKSTLELFDTNRNELETLSHLWRETEDNALTEQAPPAIMEYVASVGDQIKALRDTSKKSYDSLLTLSQMVTTRLLNIEEHITHLREMRTMLSNRLFYQNSSSFIELMDEETFKLNTYIVKTNANMREHFDQVLIYVNTNKDEKQTFVIASAVVLLFVFYFYYLYRKERLFVLRESVNQKEFFFIGRPFSTALILLALVAVLSFSERPSSFGVLMYVVIFVPVLRIMQTLVTPTMLRYYYSFVLINLLLFYEKHGVGSELVDRTFNLLGTLALIVLMMTFIKSKTLKEADLGFIQKLIYSMLPITVVLLGVSLMANFYGAVMLAERLSYGISYLIMMVVIFYVLTIMLTAYVVLILRRRISSASNLMERYAKKMERNIVFLIKLAMSLWWGWAVLIVLGLKEKSIVLFNTLLQTAFTVGNVTMTVQSFVDFVMILLGTWAVVKVLNIILTVEVFARIKFPRGVPTAITTTSNYVIVISGILMALTSLGISADQFAIIFGALGVGIGFGLRNIIANFVSGIIMVFERPVQIGDTIEIDSTMGKVQSIGTRSTAIKTFDGSEVIIPNADFISKKVTNWTLSDDRRRKVLEFKVDFDSDIDTVLGIMNEVVARHPNVLEEPEPKAVFLGFGEYYLEFKLYFWLSENLMVAQSEIAIEVYRRLKAEGIKMPTPKQVFVSENKDELL